MGRKKKEETKENNIKNRFVVGFYACVVLCVAIPICLGAISLYSYVNSSSMFSLKEVVVVGNKRLKDEEFKAYVGISKNQKIYNLDIQKIKNEIEANPLVESVVIRRQLPDRIIIDINERETFALVYYKGKKYEVDINGVVLDVTRENVFNVPIIDGVKGLQKGVNLGSVLNTPRFNKGLLILKEVLTSEVSKYFKIVKINLGNIRQVRLYTEDKIEIHLGNDGIKKKLNTLALLLAEKKAEMKNARYIDLRFGGVIIRPHSR